VLQLGSAIAQLIDELAKLEGYLYTIFHPNTVIASLLENSLGPLLQVWFKFILSTTDIESGRDFITNATIQRFEPKIQLLADGALVLIAVWSAYRIMWGHGLFTQYTARILLPRLVMAAVLINFSLPLFQMAVDASNTVSLTVQSFVVLNDPSWSLGPFQHLANPDALEILTIAVLAAAYDVFAITYLIRYAILIVLAITAPLAGLLFMLPETNHLSKMWTSHFTTNLFMQPAQLFVLSIGFGLERDGISPIHHLFAIATLLIVLKVPGAFGGAEKVAHKLESTVSKSIHYLGHALARA
jgi:hypothetical protein